VTTSLLKRFNKNINNLITINIYNILNTTGEEEKEEDKETEISRNK
jgi:hypothetical protein